MNFATQPNPEGHIMQNEQDLKHLRSGVVISVSFEKGSRGTVTTVCVSKAELHLCIYTPSTAHGGGR